MKKLISLLIISLLLMASACAAPPPLYNFGVAINTWGEYESTTYSVTRYYHLTEDGTTKSGLAGKLVEGNKIPIGTGTSVYTISAVDETKFRVDNELSFTYVSKEEYTEDMLGATEYARYLRFMKAYNTDTEFFGKTDTIKTQFVGSSTANDSFAPISVSKEIVQASTGNNFSYSYSYAEHKYTAKFDDVEKSRTFKAKQVKNLYDNEQLLLFVRILNPSSFALGSTINISGVTNWTDNIASEYKNKNAPISKYTFTATADKEAFNLDFPELTSSIDSETSKFTTMKVTLTNAASDRKGPSIEAYYETSGAIRKDIYSSTRLLMKTVQYAYDTAGAGNTLAISTEFSITALNYSNIG